MTPNITQGKEFSGEVSMVNKATAVKTFAADSSLPNPTYSVKVVTEIKTGVVDHR